MAKRILSNLLIEGDVSVDGSFIYNNANSILASASVITYSDLKDLGPKGHLLVQLGEQMIKIPYFLAPP
jgi:hypothetical protein